MSDVRLGELITKLQERDAVHIAIAPVVAGEVLRPGQDVGFRWTDHPIVVSSANPLTGIIDPFLKRPVVEGQRCWMFVYPNTITTLRHEWVHPQFPTWKKPAATNAEAWMVDFARTVQMTMDEVLQAAQEFLDTGESYCLPFDTPDNVWSDREQFWEYFAELKGQIVPEDRRDEMFFRCAC